MEQTKVSLASQLRKDFMRPDQKLTEFMAEMKVLDAQDKADFVRLYKDAGIEIA